MVARESFWKSPKLDLKLEKYKTSRQSGHIENCRNWGNCGLTDDSASRLNASFAHTSFYLIANLTKISLTSVFCFTVITSMADACFIGSHQSAFKCKFFQQQNKKTLVASFPSLLQYVNDLALWFSRPIQIRFVYFVKRITPLRRQFTWCLFLVFSAKTVSGN